MDTGVSDTLESVEKEEFQTPPELNDSSSTANAQEGVSNTELRNLIDQRQTRIAVVGCGGAGCNTIHRMHEEGIHGADLMAINTDVQHLVQISADSKCLIGQERTKGEGTGSLPQVGERAAQDDIEIIINSIAHADMVFVTAGLGGGTGTGAAPVVAAAAKQTGALTVAIVTMPFTAEGTTRHNNAEAGLERLRAIADTVIVIPNDRLLATVGDLPVKQAFRVADELLMRSVKELTELITTSGLINTDFADVQTVMKSGGVAMIGFGESRSESRAQDAVTSALRSPLLDVDISEATAVLVNVTGGPGMTIEEAEGVVEELYTQVDSRVRIIWGTTIDEDLEDLLRIMVIVTGVTSPQVYGREETTQQPTSQWPQEIDQID